ncbi:hypothetical protein C0581_02880 [Candidatus Parcubacteria bacterium]|nr:MAG: hypothetical protein C0581_02880 [Candidatus Parcubacteria bacterium]
MKNLRRQLKEVKQAKGLVNPDPSWVLENKQKLLNQISNTTAVEQKEKKQNVPENMQYAWLSFTRKAKVFLPQNMASLARPLATAVLALLLTTSGWVASAYAEPGDVFWGTKEAFGVVVEHGRLVLTRDDDEAPLHLEFASKRAKVLQQVVDRENIDPVKKKKMVQKAVEDVEKKLASADESLQKISPEKASKMVKDVSLKTKEISKTLKDTAKKVEVEDSEFAKDINKKATESTKKSLEMVEVVVQKKIEAQLEISEDEKNVIKEHIDEVVGNLKQDAQKAQTQAEELTEGVETGAISEHELVTSTVGVVEEVENSVEGDPSTTTSDSIDTEIEAVSTTTSENVETADESDVEQTIQSGSLMESGEKVKNVVKTIGDAVESFDEDVEGVDVLVEEDILEAIKKTQELNDSVEQAVDGVSKTVEELLPHISNSGLRDGETKDVTEGDEESVSSVEEK